VDPVQGRAGRLTTADVREAMRSGVRYALLAVPILFVVAFLLVPLGLTVAISFWERAGLQLRPAFTLDSYLAFFDGARLSVLERSLVVSAEATAVGLLIAYPIAYFLSTRLRPNLARMLLLLFAVPFLVNYIIRNFAWTWLLGRTGPINRGLIGVGIVDQPVDWLLYSDFAVFVGLVTSYMPFMIFPLWLALAGIDRRLIEASWLLGASPARTFLRVTLPLSLPGVFAAVIFGFVGCFGESAVPIILGGVGYQLMGNTITSALDVLNYPLAAAMSTVVVGLMTLLLLFWYLAFDMRAFLGNILRWRF
jgi:ABC-type spermidine/putrescine transport system permease subunit I